MDETNFRNLLARHWTSLFEPRTLERGIQYQQRGLVRALRYTAGDGEGVLIGSVQGSAREPYNAGVRLQWSGVDAQLDSYCTCPMEYACKHVAALILQELRGAPASDAAEAGSVEPQLGAWKNWLDGLRAVGPIAGAAPPAPALVEESVCAVLLRADGAGPVPTLQAQAVRVKPGKRGGYVTPQPLQPSWADPAPWRGLDEATFQLVAGLRMRVPVFGGSGGWFQLAFEADEPLLETLLASLPCFFDKVSAGRLTLGPLRALRIGWEAREDGTQKLALSVDGAAAKSRLFKIGGLWYFDPQARELGRVDGNLRLAEAVLRAPPLLPEQVPLLMERWRDMPLLAALPQPAAPVVERQRAVVPQPVLALRAVSAYAPPSRPYQAGIARLSFDYAGVRVPAFPAPARERHRQGDRVVEIVRDRAREMAAFEQLEELSLVPAEMLASLRGIATRTLNDNDFVLAPGQRQVAAADQLFALVPRLRECGFRLESDAGFPFELIDGEVKWNFEIDEHAGSPWFDLRLGIDVGGERIDLLPILHRLLADPVFPLAPRKGEAEGATWLVPLDARRRIALPLSQLRELIAPLLEWLQGPLRETDGALRLRRAQADVIEALTPAIAAPWRGGERLREQLERRHGQREPTHEPEGFRASLRGYQRDGLAWLDFLSDSGLGGILADDMGLGKTAQALAHVLLEKETGRLTRPALVVLPTSLLFNWQAEAARMAPGLRVLSLHGPDRARRHLQVAGHDLVLTTYPLLWRDVDALAREPWHLLILDEAQMVKNAGSRSARALRQLRAPHLLCLTGTPLENHLGELWAQFDFLMPGFLGDARSFNARWRKPIEENGETLRARLLAQRVRPFILRRRKQDVATELPPRTETIQRVQLQGKQRELYEAVRTTADKQVRRALERQSFDGAQITILDALLKLRQVCCDPRLVKGIKQGPHAPPLRGWGLAGERQKRHPQPLQRRANQPQHFSELRKHQHPVAAGHQRGQHLTQQREFGALHGGGGVQPFDQVRVTTHLAQLE